MLRTMEDDLNTMEDDLDMMEVQGNPTGSHVMASLATTPLVSIRHAKQIVNGRTSYSF